MRTAVAALLSLVVLALVRAPVRARADEPDPLRIEAQVPAHAFREPVTTVVIEPAGAVRVVRKILRPADLDVTLEFSLMPAELDEARRLVVESRFFDTWPRPRFIDDGEVWDVTVRLGDRSLRRPRLTEQPEFERLGAYLRRFVRQAATTAELRGGHGDAGTYELTNGKMAEFYARPSALVPEIVACAAGIEAPARCARTAELLLSFPVETWSRAAQDLLGRLDGDRRGAVLAAWIERLSRPDRGPYREAFHATALGVVEKSLVRWSLCTNTERIGVERALRMLLRDRVPAAIDLAEGTVTAHAKSEGPFQTTILLEAGPAAIPAITRLLGADDPVVRAEAADLACAFAAFARGRRGHERSLPEEVRPGLEALLERDIVPALERCAADPAQPFSVRKACLDALDAWDGRAKAAQAQSLAEQAEARRLEDAERRTSNRPPLVGELSIAGRVVGPFDVPLAGFVVLAARSDGRCLRTAKAGTDGLFRIDGLVEGTYELGVTPPGETRLGTRGPFDRDGVAAGATDVVVRLAGSMIRGRLFDASGSPATGRRVIGSMRDEPTIQGPAYGTGLATTDAEGRFWLLRLLPGVYDLDVPGDLALDGARGVDTGPDERTVRILEGASIAGRVVDETGAPLAGVEVTANDPAPFGSVLQGTSTRSDGAFRIERLDPALRYHVWALLPGSTSAHADAKDVTPGGKDLTLRVDTTPRLRVRVTFVGREKSSPKAIRLEGVVGGQAVAREFLDGVADWRGAPPGTWKVSAQAFDLDAKGAWTVVWIDVGKVTSGDPEKVFEVAR